MSQDVPARLGAALADRYRVERELGAGGMATVYLARDLKHDRDVAIKVLRPELGAVLGADRFLAEIKVTANLQHPHLLPLFDSGEADGLLFYVMPFVEGETLRARLDREKQLPIAEVVRLASAIAQALDYAHRRGVIHRDLKPENILLPDGQPLVADFGIALAVSNAGGQRVTQTGLSLGTPQYMSPEQATGDRAVDARTDIYSLGAMTYEMVTGEPPHGGNTAQAIIAKLMTEEVRPLSVLRRSVPGHVDAAVRRALEKLAADRFSTAGEFAAALQGRGDPAELARYLSGPALVTGSPAAPAGRGARWREVAAWVVAIGAVAALGWTRTHQPSIPEAPVIRVPIDVPQGERVMTNGFPIAISPNGDKLAYVTESATGYRTVVQRVSDPDARVVLARRSLKNVAFSPDGRSIVYSESGDISRIAAEGGTSDLIGSSGGHVIAGLAWAPDGTIVVGADDGLFSIPARGGAIRRLVDSAQLATARFPALLPDGRTVIVSRQTARQPENAVAVSLTNGTVTPIPLSLSFALGMVDGLLVYGTARGDLAAVPFDPARLRPTGDPITVARNIDGYGLSASGTLALHGFSFASRLVLVGDSDVVVRPDSAQYHWPRFSPDGRRIAVSVHTDAGADIWVLDRDAGTFTRLTSSGENTAPEWSPDGRRIIFKSLAGLPGLSGSDNHGSSAILGVAADGSGRVDTLFEPPREVNEAVMSPDGRWLVVRTAPGSSLHRDILMVDLAGDRKTWQPLVVGPASEQMPRLSPDGRWLAYQSDQSGRSEIYVRPFPGDGPRIQVSTEGGTEPLWDHAGRTLFYRTTNGIAAASLEVGTAITVTGRRLALPATDDGDPTHPAYDVAPDGKHFLVRRPVGADPRAVVIHNWARELRDKIRAAPR